MLLYNQAKNNSVAFATILPTERKIYTEQIIDYKQNFLNGDKKGLPQ